MHRDPQTHAIHLILEYKCQGSPPFMVPADEAQMIPDAFLKADCFGFKVALSEDLILSKDTQEVDLGLELKVPPKVAFLHIGLLEGSLDYVIDKQDEEFYKVKLYFNKYISGHTFEKGTPALKILPLPNEKFSFRYQRRN